ncbi:hypothetical protein AB6N24_18520 [Cellulomonas sp. 179-A 4D5 NHS]|uniref:hypothetical protein n=1 Tax=Cellulomonas sp. 179-A 4D5 NHS TaxID=3142378 RepID=UPI0039A366C3
MFDRLLPTDIFRAHWKALSDYRGATTVPDYPTRAVLLGAPLLATALSFKFGFELRLPEGALAALALLAGGFLTAFTHLSSVRLRLTEREPAWGDAERFDRDAIDETCAHLLVAAYMSGVATGWLLLGMNFGAGAGTGDDMIVGFWAAIEAGLLVYVVVLFLITLPRLYQAYLTYAHVRDALNGAHRD